MSLRIRRGLNSQRSSVLLDTGEIAWATDTKKLYVGDGSTTGGVHVLATSVDETSGLAWDSTTQKIKYTGALGTALSNIVEDLSPELGGNLNLNNRTINGTGTINFTGGITASTLSLATGLSASLSLNNQNITGTGNIGITGNLSATGTISTTTGLGANLALNNYNINGFGNINIVGFLAATGPVTVGNTITDGTLNIYNQQSSYCVFNSLAGANTAFMEMQVSNGTFATPTPVTQNDLMGGIIFRGYVTGGTFERAVVIGSQADGNVVNGQVPGKFLVVTTNAAGAGFNTLSFDKNGVLSTPILQVANVSGTLPTSPAIGMIVLDGTIFKGYTSAGWVDLNV